LLRRARLLGADDVDIGFNFSGTVVDGGREIVFVETDPGTTLIVKARRQG